MDRFWNFDDSGGERVLYLEGAISDETWWGDEVTPQIFKQDLYAGTGDVTVLSTLPVVMCLLPPRFTPCSKNIQGKSQ